MIQRDTYTVLWSIFSQPYNPASSQCLAQSGPSMTNAEWMDSIRMSLNVKLKFGIGIKSLKNIQISTDVLYSKVLLVCTKKN